MVIFDQLTIRLHVLVANVFCRRRLVKVFRGFKIVLTFGLSVLKGIIDMLCQIAVSLINKVGVNVNVCGIYFLGTNSIGAGVVYFNVYTRKNNRC